MAFNNGADSKKGAVQTTAYLGHILNPTGFESFEEFRQGALVVNAAGKIVAVGNWEDLRDKYKSSCLVIDYGKRLILPGLIDLHTHLVQIAEIGKWGDTLLGWLNKYIFPEEARFASDSHAKKLANWFFKELAANGTTLAAVFTSVHKSATDIAFQTAATIGNRVIMGKVMMDKHAPNDLVETTKDSLADSEELCAKWHNYDNGRLMYAFTPRFAPTCSPELMKATAKLWAKYPGSYMQTHLSENLDEITWVKELFPNCKNYLDVYKNHGLAGKNSIFAHGIHLENDEIKTLVETTSAVAHCPGSNMFLKSGIFNYESVRRNGVKFGLGSDVAAGPQISIFAAMKDANYVQPKVWIKPIELFYSATLGGAKAVNLDHIIGNFALQKEADFIVVDPSNKSSVVADILEHNADDILSCLIYSGDERMINATYVRGIPIYERQEATIHGHRMLTSSV